MSRTKNATKTVIAAAYAMDAQFDAEAVVSPDDTPMVEVKEDTAPVVIDTLDNESKLRLSIKGGKFAPVVFYRGVADVDGVACLVGHDVEYAKERVTPVDTLAKVEVKAKRYVEVPVDLVRTVTLPERVTPVEVKVPAE